MESRRGSGVNRNDVPKDVEQYLDGISEPARSTLKKIRAVIRSVVPPETTEIISYRIPAFRYKEVLVWYAASRIIAVCFRLLRLSKLSKRNLMAFLYPKAQFTFPQTSPCLVLSSRNRREIADGK